MRPYKRLTLICGMIAFSSLAICLFLHYLVICSEMDFWIDVCLAVFGSALLSGLTALVTYFHEKRSTLEGFMYHCKGILHALNKYQDSMSLEDKMKFFLSYHDIDKSAWDADYGNMDFFTEKFTKNREYIYEKIYLPILRFNQAVGSHVWRFRWYFDSDVKNESVMKKLVEELEQHLLYRNEKSIPTECDETGKPIAFCKTPTTKPKLILEISQELNGRYYDIMYGKRRKI